MRKMSVGLLVALCLGLTACTTLPTSPAQSVYAMKTTYAGALSIAVAYKRLPDCAKTNAKLCSRAAVVADLQSADKTAFVAMEAAEDAVRTPGFGFNVNTAINLANSALVAFTALTSRLEVR